MRRNLATIAMILLALGLLIALNVIFISEPRQAESEASGDRSSYKGTYYGTLAYYRLLEQSGHQVSRLEQPYTELPNLKISTLLIVMPNEEHQPSEDELAALTTWVSGGGKVIVVDRFVNVVLGEMSVETGEQLKGDVRPVAATPLTRGTTKLRVSEFATAIRDVTGGSVVEFASPNGSLVIDRPVGDGHAIFVADTYPVQNNGIMEADNLALALNLVDAYPSTGAVAFDEYHHGYGGPRSGVGAGLRGYIAGTPLPWIIAQLGLLAIVIALTIGRRLGRPIPLETERRTGSLVFVSSMANIQRLAGASDLAIDNIASSFRSKLCRYAGLPSNAPIKDLARVAGERAGVNPDEISGLLHRCESSLVGDRPSQSELLSLIVDLRALQAKMKL